MMTKGKNTSPERIGKKPRKTLDLEIKKRIITHFEEGKKVNAIAHDLQLSHSTISTVLKNKIKIMEAVKSSACMKSTIITKKRQGPIHEMEKILILWIEDQIKKCVPLSLTIIQAKARSLFATLREQAGEDYVENFTASHGWFTRFKRRYNLYNIRVKGETRRRYYLHNIQVKGEAANADEEVAENFIESFDALISEEGYLPEQIFNVGETGLFWKRMPERTFIHKEAKSMPGFKTFKDRITLLLGGNAVGFKLKPFLLYHSENPRAFKNINRHTLPAHYRASRKLWMTQALFEDWFLNCFIPSVQQYCLEKKVPFKILLLLDNTPGHPPRLDDLYPNVKVISLPPLATAIIQPIDQGAISTFKAYYLRTIFSQAIEATENDKISLRDYWKAYNILTCIKNIAAAWENVTEICMNGIWKKCLKRYVYRFNGFNKEDTLSKINADIVDLAKSLELEVELEDVEELLSCELKELTKDELTEIEETVRITEEEEEENQKEESKEEEEPQKTFSVKGLANVFSQVNKALADLESMDMNVERFAKVDRQIREALICYRKIYEDKKKQTRQVTLNTFLKHMSPTSTYGEECDEPSTSVPKGTYSDSVFLL